ncbi:MAG: glycosyltransferase [Actinomycetota bacterium]
MTRRALLLVSTLDGSGPGRVMTILAEGLLERGIEPVLAATHGPYESPLIQEAREHGVTVINLAMRSMWDPGGATRFATLLRSWRPDVVHTRTIRADLLGRLAARRGIPVINNVVNMYPDDCLVRLGPVVGRGVMVLARSTTDAVRLFAANARAVADNTIDAFGVSPERVDVVYDGLLLDRWRNAEPRDLGGHGVSAEDIVCLIVARLHPQKGLDDLIVASEKVVAERPDARFVVAGEGPERSALLAQIASAGLQEHVILLGNRDDVPELMARADLSVLPSRFEGLPSAIIEAMAAGLPVVASATAGVPELVCHEETGWLVPPAAPDELGQAILAALSNKHLHTIGSNAQARADKLFSAERMTQGFAEMYEAVQHG